ncbi:type IV pilin protein [Thiohalomonas denitrificans]|uniref:Type IV pilus assembly protein PilE n=1 Tax=Thiohalomonas denitrificans TaxID=415747 RepID=A0A1G5PQ70_9GAMM|nr:type IV pilin protein [Thiohalomonas denitrificans]SCZ51593.1 type IV pilus assembly protein PilE [Thiohalomonas denitrificans]
MRDRGFTLIEIMIVVAIVGILAMVAYPTYKESVQKSRRSDAMAALLELQLSQEKLRTSCAFYAEDIQNTSACGADAAGTDVAGSQTSPEGFYNIDIVTGTGSSTGYTATATPTGGQTGDSCGTFAINKDGPDHSGTYADSGCWGK